MTYLISLISDHILPAYLFIKEMEGRYDQLLFVTSHRMVGSGRGKRIERTLCVPEGSVRRVVVSDEDLNDTLAELEAHRFSSDDRFIVNLSCDATILALGAFEYFSKYMSSFYFIPPGKNIIENVRTSHNQPLLYRANVWEYFTLHGLRFECNEELTYPRSRTDALFERFKRTGYNRYKIPEMMETDRMSERDSRYYSGTWFEEYTYHRVKEEKGLRDDCIYTGVKIYRSETSDANDNEIDIVYVINNELHIGECKVSLKGVPGNSGVKLLEQYLYKLAAISIDFGLNVRQFVFTLHRFNRNPPAQMEAVRRRMKILQLEGLIDGDDFKKQLLPLHFQNDG